MALLFLIHDFYRQSSVSEYYPSRLIVSAMHIPFPEDNFL